MSSNRRLSIVTTEVERRRAASILMMAELEISPEVRAEFALFQVRRSCPNGALLHEVRRARAEEIRKDRSTGHDDLVEEDRLSPYGVQCAHVSEETSTRLCPAFHSCETPEDCLMEQTDNKDSN